MINLAFYICNKHYSFYGPCNIKHLPHTLLLTLNIFLQFNVINAFFFSYMTIFFSYTHIFSGFALRKLWHSLKIHGFLGPSQADTQLTREMYVPIFSVGYGRHNLELCSCIQPTKHATKKKWEENNNNWVKLQECIKFYFAHIIHLSLLGQLLFFIEQHFILIADFLCSFQLSAT